MKLNEWLKNHTDFIGKIDYINTNLNSDVDTIYYLLLGLHGNKEVSAILDSISDDGIIADMVNLEFAKKWGIIKTVYDLDTPTISTKESGTTETTTNDIYGYNGESTRDYKKVVEILKNNNYDDLFKVIKYDLDTLSNLNYYKIIVADIATIVATNIY